MPYNLRYEPQSHILYATLTHVPTRQESMAILQQIITSTDYPADVPTLWDVRALDAHHLNPGVFRQFIDIRRHFPARGNTCIAILVDSDVAYGMARMYEMLSEASDVPQIVCVFRNCIEAEQWLRQQVLAQYCQASR